MSTQQTDPGDVAQPKSIFIVGLEFPREVDEQSNRWFDYDHVPERLSCAGFLGCERYSLTGVEPIGWRPVQRWTSYINVYAVESPNVLETDAYRRQRTMNDGLGSRWRQVRHAENDELGRTSPSRSLRSAWVKRLSPWARSSSILARPPRALFVLLRNMDADAHDAVNRYLDEEYVPELLGLPGFISCERYEAGEPIDVITGKSGKLVQPGFLDVFDVSSPEVLTSQAFRQFHAANHDRPAFLQAQGTIVSSGVYTQRPSPWLVTVG